jgi:hypothetical protein
VATGGGSGHWWGGGGFRQQRALYLYWTNYKPQTNRAPGPLAPVALALALAPIAIATIAGAAGVCFNF